MQIWQLEDCLDSLIDQEDDMPGVDLAEAVLALAEKGSWNALEQVFGTEGAATLQSNYETDSEAFRKHHKDLARKFRHLLIDNSVARLASLSRLTFAPGIKLSFLEEIQRKMDSDGVMLEIAFARKFIRMIDPAASRASQLRECIVNEPSSELADKYLEEACHCYYFGLHTACAVMCRSLLEEALERKLPNALLDQWRKGARDGKLTLGQLLDRVNNHYPLPVPATFLEPGRKVNEIGSRGAHQNPVSESEALKCLQHARSSLVVLLGSNASSAGS